VDVVYFQETVNSGEVATVGEVSCWPKSFNMVLKSVNKVVNKVLQSGEVATVGEVSR